MAYHNRIARVNLTTGKVAYEAIPDEWKRKYVGGRGLGVRYCFEAGPKVEPLSAENLVCFMAGPLTGTRAPMSGRLAVITKSPLTGGIASSHQGGWSGARLRWAGLDGIVVEGKSDKPVYLHVEGGNVSIEDAKDIWGKGTPGTLMAMQEKYGKDDLSVVAIGPAGENKVKFACWINEDNRAAGRGGAGAVGGFKNLKAVVIKAKMAAPEAVMKDEFKKAQQEGLGAIIAEGAFTQPKKGGLSVFGTNILTNITNSIGAHPTRNAQEQTFATAELYGGEMVVEKYLVNNPACHSCPVACKKEVKTEYAGKTVHMESVEYESAWGFGAFVGNDNFPAVATMIDMCNRFGMDTIDMAGALACYAEVCQNGWNTGDTLAWGDHAKMVELVEKTAFRDGVGDLLAEASAGIAKHFGHPEISMSVRGMGIPAYDPRGLKGMGLGYATSNRGACHVNAYTPASELGVIGWKTDPLDWTEKPKLVQVLQDLFAFTDSLDVCKFSSFSESADQYAAQYATAVGISGYTADDLLKDGERIYNLERYYNILAGEKPGSDVLPERFTKVPSTAPGSMGHVNEFDQMLAAYYELRDWKNGVPSDAKLKELGII